MECVKLTSARKYTVEKRGGVSAAGMWWPQAAGSVGRNEGMSRKASHMAVTAVSTAGPRCPQGQCVGPEALPRPIWSEGL